MTSEPSPDEIRGFRDNLGLTKSELAEKIGGAVRTVEDWEAGRRKAPAMLRLALAAVARGLSPWEAMPTLGPGATLEDVERETHRLFAQLGDDFAEDLHDQFSRSLTADATPAETLLLGAMMGVSDGYNRVELWEDWASRPKVGWHTSMGFRPDMHGARPTLGFETRHGAVAKHLAVFVDSHRPGERLPEKLRVETAMVTRGVRVISFSAVDVLVDSGSCKDTIETVLSEIVDEVLHEDGQIGAPWKRPDRR